MLQSTVKRKTFEIDIIYNRGFDFDKGCFIGQEVIARVKYKGSIKKKYISFKINSSEIIDNTNIKDCLLLGSKRIGHGFLLYK